MDVEQPENGIKISNDSLYSYQLRRQTQNARFKESCLRGDLVLADNLLRDYDIDINWRNSGGFTPLYSACQENMLGLAKLLLAKPTIIPDLRMNQGATPLYVAAQNGHYDIVLCLLKDGRIHPDIPKSDNVTPLYIACQCEHRNVVELLLSDDRVNPNEIKNNQTSPLWIAAQQGKIEIVMEIFAHKSQIELHHVSKWNGSSALQRAIQVKKPEIAQLIKDYLFNPEETRRKVRGLLGWNGHFFALIVLYCDSYLRLRKLDQGALEKVNAQRFLRITHSLPLELQMMISNRIYPSKKDFFLSSEVENKILANLRIFQF